MHRQNTTHGRVKPNAAGNKAVNNNKHISPEHIILTNDTFDKQTDVKTQTNKNQSRSICQLEHFDGEVKQVKALYYD